MSDAKPAGGSAFSSGGGSVGAPLGSASEPSGAELPLPGTVKPVVRPNLPRTGVDARELARVLARQHIPTGGPLLPPIDEDPAPRAPVAHVAAAPAAAPAPPRPERGFTPPPVVSTRIVPEPSPAVPAALRSAGADAGPISRAPRGMELARAPRALSAMEALDAARAAERATLPGAHFAAPGPARGPSSPVPPRLAAPRANTSPFSTARPRVEVPRIDVASPHLAPASTPSVSSTEPSATLGLRAPRGISLPPAPHALSAEDALVAARAAESAPDAPHPELVPASSPLVQAVQAVLATSLPDVPVRVTAVAHVEPRVHLALWKAHRARLAGQGDLRGALAAAVIVQAMTSRPHTLTFAAVHAVLPRAESYFMAVDLDQRLPVAVLPEADRWGVRF